jgi:hypothetical protein
MRAIEKAEADDLDDKMLRERLTQYAKRLGLSAPENPDRAWLREEARVRNLLRTVGDDLRPTLAG